jgi:predicted nucleic acid-binding Zn ribbon protein
MICPQCSGPLERPLTAPGLSFKGAGWYVNDYASRPSSSSDNKPASDSANGTGDSKSDSKKPDAKPATDSKPASTESTSKPASSSTPTTT